MEYVLLKIQAFAMNGSDRVCNGACFYLQAVVVCVVKIQAFTMNGSYGVYDSLSLSPCCGSLLLVKLQVLTINGSDRVCDRACAHLFAVAVCF